LSLAPYYGTGLRKYLTSHRENIRDRRTGEGGIEESEVVRWRSPILIVGLDSRVAEIPFCPLLPEKVEQYRFDDF
jgi:hypothetical protein